MLSTAQSKYIRSLTQQKYRKQNNVFLVEGDKIAREWLSSAGQVQLIVATQDWVGMHLKLISAHPEAELITVTDQELEHVSALQAAHKVLLVVPLPLRPSVLPADGWSIAVAQLQDPGNMGTIIRIADWFGLQHIIASPDSVDFYNPKVVQAGMGGHLRVALHTVELEHFLAGIQLPVLAATLGGTNIYELDNPGKGVILIGNESKGLPDSLQAFATHRITIPKKGGAESLNAGVSAGIITALLAGR